MTLFRHPDDEYNTNCEPLTQAEKEAVIEEEARELKRTYCLDCCAVTYNCSGCEDFEIAFEKQLRERSE